MTCGKHALSSRPTENALTRLQVSRMSKLVSNETRLDTNTDVRSMSTWWL
jgi:hypothetical protein